MWLYVGILVLTGAFAALLIGLDVVDVSRRSTIHGSIQERRRRRSKAQIDPDRIFVDNDLHSVGRLRIFTIPTLLDRAERNLVLAGRPAGWSIKRLVWAKVVLVGVAGFFGLSFWAFSPTALKGLAVLGVIALVYCVPDIWLDARAKERQEQIERDLPDILDQATIAIESGLSFEAALSRVGDTARGPLADEIVRTVQDMRLGMSRRDAYSSLAERTSVADLKRFSKNIVQAEEFGVSVSTVVRNLSLEMRVKRKYRAEAAAAKIPVKMIFPLGLCIFPVLFIVLLYPAFADLGRTFGGMN